MPKQRRDMPWCDFFRGKYHAFWYDAAARQTRRLSLGTADPAEAQSRFAAFLTEGGPSALSGQRKTPTASGLTVVSALDDYWREHVEREVVDQKRIRHTIDHLKAFFGERMCVEIDIPLCRAYAEARRTGAVGKLKNGTNQRILVTNSTIVRELVTLRAALNHAVKWKRLSRADLPHIETPTVTGKGKELWLFPDELSALRSAATGRAQGFIEVAYWTAARKASVEALTLFQVSLEKRRINLSPPGDRETKKRRPIVPIVPELVPTIERLVRDAKAAGTEYLMGSAKSCRAVVERTAQRAGVYELPERDMRPAGQFSPHVLRHTRATHLLQAGTAPWAVANLLGDTVTTVLRTYGHHCPDYLAEVMQKEHEL